jgi:putative hydrolase of the HAD superfamily/hydrolase
MSQETKIKAVIFDCFGVLVQGTLDRFREKYLRGATDDTKREFSDLSHASDRGMIAYDEFVAEAAKLANISVAEANATFRDTPKNVKLLDFIREKLRANYKIALLSNIGSGRILRVLTEDELNIFDEKILSYEVHFAKPDPEIYLIAADKLDVEPAECVFVDDARANVDGAKSVGMRGILYEDFDGFREKLDAILRGHKQDKMEK